MQDLLLHPHSHHIRACVFFSRCLRIDLDCSEIWLLMSFSTQVRKYTTIAYLNSILDRFHNQRTKSWPFSKQIIIAWGLFTADSVLGHDIHKYLHKWICLDDLNLSLGFFCSCFLLSVRVVRMIRAKNNCCPMEWRSMCVTWTSTFSVGIWRNFVDIKIYV